MFSQFCGFNFFFNHRFYTSFLFFQFCCRLSSLKILLGDAVFLFCLPPIACERFSHSRISHLNCFKLLMRVNLFNSSVKVGFAKPNQTKPTNMYISQYGSVCGTTSFFFFFFSFPSFLEMMMNLTWLEMSSTTRRLLWIDNGSSTTL